MKPNPSLGDDIKLFLVGGCVRDALLKKPSKDRDYVVITELTFDQLVKRIKDKDGKIFISKPEFYTIRCEIDKQTVDIAFPRTEDGYLDGRHPSAVSAIKGENYLDVLRADAGRRDFTINAMYMREDGEIIDFFNGQGDLKDKIIRAVGHPSDRFKEDYLRILRALRFSVKLGFNIDADTEKAMKEQVCNIGKISMDRIKEELNKMLRLDNERAVNYVIEYDLIKHIAKTGLWFRVTNEKKNKGGV